MGKDDGSGVSVFDIYCTGWDYRNQEYADLALQGNLPGVYTHIINNRDLVAVVY